MKQNSKYIVCPLCGSNLDFGEKCDCEKLPKAESDATKGSTERRHKNESRQAVSVEAVLLHH